MLYSEDINNIELIDPNAKEDNISPEHEEFLKYYNLASRSYMGGLNSSFILGKTKGIILDIDLASCYPSALNMIENLSYNSSGGITEFKQVLKDYDGSRLPIAIADISFKFPSECLYPSLPIKNGNAGLFYVLEGRTTCTLTEIHFALSQGCEISQWHEAVVMSTKEGSYTFRNFLTQSIHARAKAKKELNQILQLIFKNYVNGLYGKIAQGINRRTQFVVGKGKSLPLPPSAITNPFIATTVTGLIRAVLSCIIDVISNLEGYTVISATTDGVLYSTPLSQSILSVSDLLFNMDVLQQYYSGSIAKALESDNNDYIHPFKRVDRLLYNKLIQHPSIRLLQISQSSWGNERFLEIKHVATELTNMKTRGQIGFYEYQGVKYSTVLAKAGNKLDGSQMEQAQRLLELYQDDTIVYNNVVSLASLKSILDEKMPIVDLVSVHTKVKFNTDYDYKRKPVNELQTQPYTNIQEANIHRSCAKYLRRNNIKSLPHRVLYATHLAKNNVRKRGNNKAFVIRHFLRALMQGIKPFPPLENVTHQTIAEMLQDFGVTLYQIKDASSRYPFIFNAVENNTGNRRIVKQLLKVFKLEDIYTEVLDILIFKGLSNAENIF